MLLRSIAAAPELRRITGQTRHKVAK